MAGCHLLKLVYCFVETFFNGLSPFYLEKLGKVLLGRKKIFHGKLFFAWLYLSFETYFRIMKFEIKCRPCLYDVQKQSPRVQHYSKRVTDTGAFL